MGGQLRLSGAIGPERAKVIIVIFQAGKLSRSSQARTSPL
jgi:hypothetical protein